MNMQYARAVLAHEQAHRDRARANHLTTTHSNVLLNVDVDGRVTAVPTGAG